MFKPNLAAELKPTSYTYIGDRAFLHALHFLFDREMKRCCEGHESTTTEKYVSMSVCRAQITDILLCNTPPPSVAAAAEALGSEDFYLGSRTECVDRLINDVIKPRLSKWGYYFCREVMDIIEARENDRRIDTWKRRREEEENMQNVARIASSVVSMIQQDLRKQDGDVLAPAPAATAAAAAAAAADDEEIAAPPRSKRHQPMFEVDELPDDDDDDDDDYDAISMDRNTNGTQFKSHKVEVDKSTNSTTTTTTTFTIGKGRVAEELAKECPPAPRKTSVKRVYDNDDDGDDDDEDITPPPPTPLGAAYRKKNSW